MLYLITAKAVYGIPMIIDAADAVEAMTKAMIGNEQKGESVFIELLPTTQWTIEPLEGLFTLLSLRNALKGMQSLCAEMGAVPYDDPRVQASYVALNDASDVIDKSRKIQEELNAGSSTGSGIDGTGQEEEV